MIVAFVITFFLNTIRIIMDMLNVPVVSILPGGMDAAVQFMFGMVFAIWNSVWFVQAPFLGFVAFLTYKVIMVGLQAFFGHRIAHG